MFAVRAVPQWRQCRVLGDSRCWLHLNRCSFFISQLFRRALPAFPCPRRVRLLRMSVTHSPELRSGVWTSWLPLTTTWPSEPGCDSAAWARYDIAPSVGFWPYIYDPAYGQSVANSPRCLPPEATQWWDGASTVSSTITSWSLGPIVCPEAYTTVSTSSVSALGTSVICCPSSVYPHLI